MTDKKSPISPKAAVAAPARDFAARVPTATRAIENWT